jgi:putative phosphoesterase
MRVAALYDIHDNLDALEAALGEVERERVELILIGGDIVSGPLPRATLERLLALGERVRCIRGNADREVVAAFDGLSPDAGLADEVRAITEWTAGQLERRHRDVLAGLPGTLALEIAGVGAVLFCHGSPRSDEEILTRATPEARLREALAGVRQDVVVCGHTHMPFDRRVDGVRVVNAGSVGMPYGAPGAHWLLLGPEEGIAPRRTDYDRERAAARIRASGYPLATDFAENNVLRPPTAEEAIAVFERMAAERAG